MHQDMLQTRSGTVLHMKEYQSHQADLTEQITDRQARRQQIELFLTGLKKREPLTVFRDEDWLAMVDYMTVTENAGTTVTFKDGTEIKA